MIRTLQTANLAAWTLYALLQMVGGPWTLYEMGAAGLTLWLMAWLWLTLGEMV